MTSSGLVAGKNELERYCLACNERRSNLPAAAQASVTVNVTQPANQARRRHNVMPDSMDIISYEEAQFWLPPAVKNVLASSRPALLRREGPSTRDVRLATGRVPPERGRK